MDLAPAASFRQIPRVRWLGILLAVLVAAPSARAATASDPAFLGIVMDDAPGFCSIQSVTPASPADDAGLQFGDAVFAIDGTSLIQGGGRPCMFLTSQIVAHRPGDEIKLDIRRGASRVTVKATLSSRGEVLHRRLVGRPMVRTEIENFDDENQSYDLSARGKTTVVGWFALQRCANCGRVFERIADGLRARLADADSQPSFIAVTSVAMAATSSAARSASARELLASWRSSFTSSVPLAYADRELFDSLALNESDRMSFMVIDCRGVVRFVAPLAPDADDLDAAVDDILAAVEQAEYQRTRRN